MRKFLIVACLTALIACSPKAEAPPAAPAPTGPAVKIYAMECGRIAFTDLDMFADDGSMKGQHAILVDPCYLIRHPSGDLIWDTGLPDALADVPGGVAPEGMPARMVMRTKLSAQLAQLGLTPADIEYVSFSHLHADHTGNGNMFAASTWIVDKDERDAMFSPARRKTDDFKAYSALETARTELIEGDASHDVFGDGTVVIYQAPGHTPGHTVLLVKTAKSGAVLLAGDMWHLADSRARRLVPRFNVDRVMTLASMDKVEALARDNNARVVRQHVEEDLTALPTFPAALE